MRRRILNLGRTGVYLHLGTVIFLLYALLAGTLPTLLTAIMSILLHEGAHAAAAALVGQPPEEIEITPMGAVMRLDDEERLPPIRRGVMLLAGPAATLLLCFLAYHLTGAGRLPVRFGRNLFLSNAAILLVNLLPVLPLDGGRLLALMLTRLFTGALARRVLRILGTFCGTGMIILSIWLSWKTGSLNLSLACAGCFMLHATVSALTTQAMAELRTLMDRKILLESRGHLPCRVIAVMASKPVHEAVKLLPPGKMAMFLVMEQGTQRMKGIISERSLVHAYLDSPASTFEDALILLKKCAVECQ